MRNQIDALEPCPFCGGRAYVNNSDHSLYVDCYHTPECSCHPSTWLYSDKDIYTQIKWWNKRVY